MTVPCVEATGRVRRHEYPARGGVLSSLAGRCLDLLNTGCRAMRTTEITPDDMSEAQLTDIGLARVGRGLKWLDCQESSLSADFQYRSAPSDGRR